MKILIFGSNGLVGSSTSNILKENKNFKIISATRNDVDLFDLKKTNIFIKDIEPNVIINAAAKVGGIVANNTNRVDFLLENLKINMNIIESIIHNVNISLINLGSSCIYPLNASNPINENSLMDGKLEPTNSPYAMAKLTSIELADSLSKQYGHKIINLMPTNLYGPNDNFDNNSSHVIPGLLARMHKAKLFNKDEFEVWGTGMPKREFLFVDDLARCISFVIENKIDDNLINIGSGFEVSIKELVNLIQSIVGYKGKINFNTSKPDGNPRKLLDSSKINKYGWKATTDLVEGLELTYKWYIKNFIK